MVAVADLALVARVACFADSWAFERLVERYQSRVRRFFLHQTSGNRSLSDDLAQETFIRAYTGFPKFRATSAFATWLYKIAYNVYLDHLRSMHNTVESDVVTDISAGVGTADCSVRVDVFAALARLSYNERTAVVLQMIDGYDIKSIAAIMRMPEGTVKSHLKRGKDKLVVFLKNNGYER